MRERGGEREGGEEKERERERRGGGREEGREEVTSVYHLHGTYTYYNVHTTTLEL